MQSVRFAIVIRAVQLAHCQNVEMRRGTDLQRGQAFH